jgi:hypothetical protein
MIRYAVALILLTVPAVAADGKSALACKRTDYFEKMLEYQRQDDGDALAAYIAKIAGQCVNLSRSKIVVMFEAVNGYALVRERGKIEEYWTPFFEIWDGDEALAHYRAAKEKAEAAAAGK